MKIYRYFSYDATLENKVLDFLGKIDRDFPVPLSEKVLLDEYSLKLCEKACILTVEKDGKLYGMLAGYIENLCDNMAYISLLGVDAAARGQGLAGQLLKTFISICEERKIAAIHVYTKQENVPAMKVYMQNGFGKYHCEAETRPQDEHLILKLGGK